MADLDKSQAKLVWSNEDKADKQSKQPEPVVSVAGAHTHFATPPFN